MILKTFSLFFIFIFFFIVVQQLNETFHKVLDDCKQINVPNMLHNTSSSTTTAEKLLYDYAVEIVRIF